MSTTTTASIIITCGPRYDRWVRDAIASALEQEGQPEIVCVFDRCEPIAGIGPRVKVVRVDHGSAQLSRRAGVDATKGQVVFFLDADNAYEGRRYVVDAVSQLIAASQADSCVAGLSSDIAYYDHEWRPNGKALMTPPVWDRSRFDRENYLDTCCPVWRHALEASWHDNGSNGGYEDYQMWGQLVRDGWVFSKGHGLTLRYRICPGSMSEQSRGSYAARTGLHAQPVTLFIPLSGRVRLWPALRDWLTVLAGSERGKRVRLVLCDTSGNTAFGEQVRREATGLGFPDLRYYQQLVATPGLADLDRKKHERAVQIACARIYNRLSQECTTGLVLVVEDDILPHQPGDEVLRHLIEGFSPSVAAVGGVYHDRRTGGVAAWSGSCEDRVWLLKRTAVQRATSAYLPIDGTGFGCLMIRRSVLQAVPHALPSKELWYDPRFFREVARRGLTVLLAKHVTCDHLNSRPSGETDNKAP